MFSPLKNYSKGTKDHLTKDDIFANDGSLKVTDMCRYDVATGLVIPGKGSEMLLANGHVMSIPADEYFVHPVTGNINYIQCFAIHYIMQHRTCMLKLLYKGTVC